MNFSWLIPLSITSLLLYGAYQSRGFRVVRAELIFASLLGALSWIFWWSW